MALAPKKPSLTDLSQGPHDHSNPYEFYDHLGQRLRILQPRAVVEHREGEDMFYLLGYKIALHYEVHEGGYVEWSLSPNGKEYGPYLELLNILLRIHYNDYIEAICREHAHNKDMYESMAPDLREDIPF